MSYRRRDVPGGLGLSLGLRIGGLLLSGAALPQPTFDYNPESGDSLPGTSTYTLNANQFYFDGSSFIVVAPNVVRDNHRFDANQFSGFLWEPASENTVPDPDDFTQSSWTRQNTLASSPAAAGAFGLRATTLTLEAFDAQHRIFATPTVLGNGSAYVIVESIDQQYLTLRRGGSSDWCCFDIANGTVTKENGAASGKIRNLGNNRYKLIVNVPSATSIIQVAASNSAEPAQANPSFLGAGEQWIMYHAQYEVIEAGTTPLGVGTVPAIRPAASFTDAAWTAEASAIVNLTIDDPVSGGVNADQVNMLGFGAGSANFLAVDGTRDAVLTNAAVSVPLTALSDYIGAKRAFGMSLAVDERIIVDDLGNDASSAVSATPALGTSYCGSDSATVGLPAVYHRLRIFDVRQTAQQLKDGL